MTDLKKNLIIRIKLKSDNFPSKTVLSENFKVSKSFQKEKKNEKVQTSQNAPAPLSETNLIFNLASSSLQATSFFKLVSSSNSNFNLRLDFSRSLFLTPVPFFMRYRFQISVFYSNIFASEFTSSNLLLTLMDSNRSFSIFRQRELSYTGVFWVLPAKC